MQERRGNTGWAVPVQPRGSVVLLEPCDVGTSGHGNTGMWEQHETGTWGCWSPGMQGQWDVEEPQDSVTQGHGGAGVQEPQDVGAPGPSRSL